MGNGKAMGSQLRIVILPPLASWSGCDEHVRQCDEHVKKLLLRNVNFYKILLTLLPEVFPFQ